MAKPFLKWAGGKSQLINDIEKSLPKDLFSARFTYVEPFVGSGAVLFWMLQKFTKIEKAVINDINEDLINVYREIASKPQELISLLETLQAEFHDLETDADKKKEYYYQQRNIYNTRRGEKTSQAALFIFLNRTCYNGLYRVNKNNQFNVPIGAYKRPTICDTANLLAVNEALQKVEILNGDFEETLNQNLENAFFYFDPPYKPLNDTASFNAYANGEFNDAEQIRLRDFCKKLDSQGHKWMLSNSDVKGFDPGNNFFDSLYSEYQIRRVKAKRMINSISAKRGQLNELLITNYT
jgi:DNA adenine methylase